MVPRSALAALALLMLTAALSGCASADADDDPTAMTTSASATATPAPLAPVVPAIPAPVTATCDITRTNAGTPVGYGIYLDRALADNGLTPPTGCALDDLFPDHAWAHSLLVEVEWTPGASMTAADGWIESTACTFSPTDPCDAPYVTSPTSPLTLTAEGDDFATHADADLEVQVAAEGLVVQQPFHVTLTLFANATVDPGFTALGSAGIRRGHAQP